MSTSTMLQFLPGFCEIATSISKSWRGQLWTIIGMLGWKGWIAVIVAILIWLAVELVTGRGNSSNGLSWRINVAVGSALYAILNTFIHLFFSKIFGDGIYCLPWPYPFHLATFWAVGTFLRWINFWGH